MDVKLWSVASADDTATPAPFYRDVYMLDISNVAYAICQEIIECIDSASGVSHSEVYAYGGTDHIRTAGRSHYTRKKQHEDDWEHSICINVVNHYVNILMDHIAEIKRTDEMMKDIIHKLLTAKDINIISGNISIKSKKVGSSDYCDMSISYIATIILYEPNLLKTSPDKHDE